MERPDSLDLAKTFNQERLIGILFVVSMVSHGILFLVLETIDLAPSFPDLTDDWVDAELITDIDMGSIDAALPQAKEAPEAKVPENILPQLPKKFTTKESAKEKAEPIPEEIVKKDERDKVEAKPKEVKKEIKSDPDEANKLEKKDLRKRKMLELLRKQQKFAKTKEAPKDDALARLASELEKNSKTNAAYGSAGAKLRAQKYRAILQSAVRRNFSLPEAYNYGEANLQVVIAIVVNARGLLTKIDIKRSSSDSVFDEMALKAVKASSPLPKPPQELAGAPMLLKFTPKSF